MIKVFRLRASKGEQGVECKGVRYDGKNWQELLDFVGEEGGFESRSVREALCNRIETGQWLMHFRPYAFVIRGEGDIEAEWEEVVVHRAHGLKIAEGRFTTIDSWATTTIGRKYRHRDLDRKCYAVKIEKLGDLDVAYAFLKEHCEDSETYVELHRQVEVGKYLLWLEEAGYVVQEIENFDKCWELWGKRAEAFVDVVDRKAKEMGQDLRTYKERSGDRPEKKDQEWGRRMINEHLVSNEKWFEKTLNTTAEKVFADSKKLERDTWFRPLPRYVMRGKSDFIVEIEPEDHLQFGRGYAARRVMADDSRGDWFFMLPERLQQIYDPVVSIEKEKDPYFKFLEARRDVIHYFYGEDKSFAEITQLLNLDDNQAERIYKATQK